MVVVFSEARLAGTANNLSSLGEHRWQVFTPSSFSHFKDCLLGNTLEIKAETLLFLKPSNWMHGEGFPDPCRPALVALNIVSIARYWESEIDEQFVCSLYYLGIQGIRDFIPFHKLSDKL